MKGVFAALLATAILAGCGSSDKDEVMKTAERRFNVKRMKSAFENVDEKEEKPIEESVEKPLLGFDDDFEPPDGPYVDHMLERYGYDTNNPDSKNYAHISWIRRGLNDKNIQVARKLIYYIDLYHNDNEKSVVTFGTTRTFEGNPENGNLVGVSVRIEGFDGGRMESISEKITLEELKNYISKADTNWVSCRIAEDMVGWIREDYKKYYNKE